LPAVSHLYSNQFEYGKAIAFHKKPRYPFLHRASSLPSHEGPSNPSLMRQQFLSAASSQRMTCLKNQVSDQLENFSRIARDLDSGGS
jgi:hypothetical protein